MTNPAIANPAVAIESAQVAADQARVRSGLALMARARSGEAGAPAAVFNMLEGFAVVRIEGADARTFLHGQISAEVLALGDLDATLAGYCSAKGRMLATFLVVRDGEAMRLVVRANLAAGFAKRLSMFVLRSKVKIVLEAGTTTLVGVIGQQRASALKAMDLHAVPPAYKAVRDQAGGLWVGLPGERTLGLLDSTQTAEAITCLSRHATTVSESCWDWIDIEQGIAYIESATQDALTPQMANLELVGGVSFQKGCYPGQEIVARTQHLGKVKRRTYRAHLPGDTAPRAGDLVFTPSHGEQSVGVVLGVAPAPGDGFDLLVSLLSSEVRDANLSVGSQGGQTLSFSALPYALPD